MNEHDLLWAMLPEGLERFFDLTDFRKSETCFRIVLTEKNTVPVDLPEEYRGKKVINTILDDCFLDDFPLRGRKGEILLKRRSWKFEGVKTLLRRDIPLCAPGTKLEKEFATFLKEMGGERPNRS